MYTIAHRGLAGLYPENTMLSFEKCLEYGPDAIELDLQLSSDGRLVIFHDEELSRTTGEKGWLKDRSFDELRRLCPSNGFDYSGLKIPTLDEYFELVKGRELKSFLELKNSFITYPGLEEAALNCIDRHKMREKVIIYSANHYSVMKFRALAPDIELCFPFDNWIFDYGEYCEKRQIKCSIPYYRAMTKELIDDFHRHGVRVYPWTVDEREEMLELIKIGADGLLTNRIDILSKLKQESIADFPVKKP